MIGPKEPKMTGAESRAGYQKAADRSFGLCEACGLHQAVQIHHRLHRSHGGDERPQNLLHVCLTCHRSAHLDSDRYTLGWSVKSGYDPAEEPVSYRGGVVWLTVDGGIDERRAAG